MQKKLSKQEIERIRALKAKYPELTRSMLAERFGVDIRTIQRYWHVSPQPDSTSTPAAD